ncbi:group II intron reverse transcriptase/maturase [Paenibacillus oralis]|uniref:Group II intron reverse transcriptase/maturase n=1 Tax=Paenibacillus oralis TaxID=2490856 RepID=A0A3P3T9F8_9BACL|nr:group II intron reverse transcriptase/maturase [Paenibacillus oralis]RRJ54667.1 group II intron reverse transcriptase/maturase [Paenibacillus oralis]
MVQKFDYPNSETEFRALQDEMYRVSHEAVTRGTNASFKGLLEIVSSEAVIMTAIHKVKANSGSKTPGPNGRNIDDILQQPYKKVCEWFRSYIQHYCPGLIRRQFIPKNGNPLEVRPLGIPDIEDRIVQDCLRSVLEPILEPQFFRHSYGFRPMRDTKMALTRVNGTIHRTGYHWVIEGDISKFFDRVNHTTLLKKLWGMGIRDRRVLMMVKSMLKAGVMGESTSNEMGTPQGGIISPLLANVYLNVFDKWVVREWEDKKLKQQHSRDDSRFRAMRKSTNLKPAYLVRYADDWVLITDSKANAEKWKRRIAKFLSVKLKLQLSEEKTKITNVTNSPVKFVGFNIKMVKGQARHGYITRTRPPKERLSTKVEEVRKAIRRLKSIPIFGKDRLVHEINVVNSKIRGIIEYYKAATWVNIDLNKYAESLLYLGHHVLRKFGGEWTKANEVNNLVSVHSKYETKIPAVSHEGMKFGLTSLAFVKYEDPLTKDPLESPYTPEGSNRYFKRTEKKSVLARADELLSLHLSSKIGHDQTYGKKLYNFEYFLNRAYAFNRDRGKCRVCGELVFAFNVDIHHVSPWLPVYLVNKVKNLATLHDTCHDLIHSDKDVSYLPQKEQVKIQSFREKLIATPWRI